MNKNKHDDLQAMGIRSDRMMTTQEVMNAAVNYQRVKDAADVDLTFRGQTSLFGKILVALHWGLIGLGMLGILIATIQTIFC